MGSFFDRWICKSTSELKPSPLPGARIKYTDEQEPTHKLPPGLELTPAPSDEKAPSNVIELVSPVPIKQPINELPKINDVMPARLALIVGHTAQAPGALSALGWTEYGYNSEVAALAQKFADQHHAERVRVYVIFRDDHGLAGAYRIAADLQCDAAIELHFNAFNNRVQGSETLCSFDAQDVAFAKIVHRKTCEVFARSGESRGVKAIPRSARGGGNVYAFPSGVNCLIEPFFGDNVLEAMTAAKRKQELAQCLIDAFVDWIGGKSTK